MPHTITGQIRKDVFTKTGSSNKGEWKMYAVELSESWKDKDGQRQYTNYRATVFGSSPAAIQYYDQVLVKDACASFTSDTLQVNQRESNGINYITLELVNPRLVFANAGGGNSQSNSGAQGSRNNYGWGQPQQPKGNNNQFSGGAQSRPQQQPQSAPASNNNEPPMDFEEDGIPF